MENILDYQNQTYHSDHNSGGEFPKNLRIFDGVMRLTAGILGMIGNTVVFIAFATSGMLHTKTNVFVVNLALADFLTSILMPALTWSLIADIDHSVPQWVDTLCAAVIGTVQVSVGCSVLNLTFIAITRCILITKTRKTYERIFQDKNVIIFLGICWLFPAAVVLIPLWFGIGELGYDVKAHICAAKSSHMHSHIYDLFIVTLLMPVQTIIISCSYALIFNFVKIHNRRLKKGQIIKLKVRNSLG